MPRTDRKIVGAALLVVFVPIYALVAMAIGAALPGTSILVQTLYFAVAGLIWIVPAGVIIYGCRARPGRLSALGRRALRRCLARRRRLLAVARP